MIDAKYVKELQVLALQAVESPTWEDWYRRLCRWYSKEFSTPLAEVYGLAEEEVIRAYHEDQFFAMKQNTDTEDGQLKYKNLIDYVTRGDEILETEALQEAQDDEWMRQELEKAAKEHAAALAAKSPPTKPNLKETKEPEEKFVQGEDPTDFLNETEPLEDN
jgi:hypothetical protein